MPADVLAVAAAEIGQEETIFVAVSILVIVAVDAPAAAVALVVVVAVTAAVAAITARTMQNQGECCSLCSWRRRCCCCYCWALWYYHLSCCCCSYFWWQEEKSFQKTMLQPQTLVQRVSTRSMKERIAATKTTVVRVTTAIASSFALVRRR